MHFLKWVRPTEDYRIGEIIFPERFRVLRYTIPGIPHVKKPADMGKRQSFLQCTRWHFTNPGRLNIASGLKKGSAAISSTNFPIPPAIVKTTITCLLAFFCVLPMCSKGQSQQHPTMKDTIIYRTIYRDTIVYKYDTVRVRHYVHSDTLWSPAPASVANTGPAKKKRVINPTNFGIGPSIGAYYSPFNGFDINIGFGVQYYFLSIPTIRKPHMHHHRK